MFFGFFVVVFVIQLIIGDNMSWYKIYIVLFYFCIDSEGYR